MYSIWLHFYHFCIPFLQISSQASELVAMFRETAHSREKITTQSSSKQILDLHALVHLLISTNWDNEGKGSAVQARCPKNAAHTQPIDGICELQQPSSPEIWSLLPRALGVAQSRHCAHRAFKKKELKREI